MVRALALILVACVLIAAGAAVALVRDAAVHAGKIFPGVAIAGVPVGRLTPAQAASAAQPVADRRLAATMTVHLASATIVLSHADLGVRADVEATVQSAYRLGRSGPWWARARTRLAIGRRGATIPLRVSLDESVLRGVVAALGRELSGQPADAEVTVVDGQVVITRPGRVGRTLDVDGTVARIAAALDAGAPDAHGVVTVVEPAFTTAEAQELRAPLATFTTTMAPNPNRTHNIALAAGFLRGVILAPGEVLSYNRTVGPRTAARGFKEAPVLVDDELVPGDGGGICQVSSTLFNVALLADFEILSRANHSRPVAYLPLGRDATVVYGWLDLEVRNTTGRHVLLWTAVRGNRLTITAFGTPQAGKVVEVIVTDRQEIPPPSGTVTKKDPELPEGRVVTREAQAGYRAKTWRVVKVDGQVVRRELVGRSVYRPVPHTIKIGAKKPGQESTRRSSWGQFA